MKKCKCEEKCECMNEEVPTTCVCPDPVDKKKKVGILVGIGTGIAAIGGAIAGVFVWKKKKEKEEK